MAVDELRFRAMGSETLVLVVDGAAHLPGGARAHVDDLETRWSRFRPDSEVSRLNALAGRAVVVSDPTLMLVARALEGWRRTGGRFDPTVLDAIECLGYDRSFEHVPREAKVRLAPRPAPGCDGVIVDEVVGAVTLPRGVRFDPGGIGKGLAADLVARALVANGATGALVSIGGDLRVMGLPRTGESWSIAVEDPFDRTLEVARIELDEGGVATSSTASRTWRRAGETVHHIVDPASGRPRAGAVAVTAVASEAWFAEVAAKAALLSDDPAAQLRDLGCSGVVIGPDGHAQIVEAA